MMSHQRKEPYSSVPQGGSYPSPSPSSTLNQTSAYSSQYLPTTPNDRPVLPVQPTPQTQLYRTVQLCQQLFHEQHGPVSQQQNTRALCDSFIEGRYLAALTQPILSASKENLQSVSWGLFGRFDRENMSIFFLPRKLKEVTVHLEVINNTTCMSSCRTCLMGYTRI